jgi:hypothetical protein
MLRESIADCHCFVMSECNCGYRDIYIHIYIYISDSFEADSVQLGKFRIREGKLIVINLNFTSKEYHNSVT